MNPIPSSRFNYRKTDFSQLKVLDPKRVYQMPDPSKQIFRPGINVPHFSRVKRF